MRDRDLKALEVDRVIAMVAALAVSEPGRRRVEALRPAIAPAEVATRLRTTAELVALRARSGSLPLEEFTDQRELMLAVAPEGAVLGGEALVRIRDFVVAARTVEAFMRSRVDAFPHLAELVSNLVAPKELVDALLGALADDGNLLDDASPELKRLRTRLRDERLELETRLARSLNAAGMEPFVADYVVTVRNRRFVLPLKLNYSERLEGIVQDRSVSGETLFVEPLWAVELNNRLMLIEREAAAEEYRLLMRLSAMVRGYATELALTFEALTALDALNAAAIFAERCGAVEPELSADTIVLRAARHPLLLATGRAVVPIDLEIGPTQRGIVISGPNTGGKTVALKTLGLFAMMAQAGLLVPAEAGTRLKIFRGVFADIGDDQSIAANLSSFAGHIANLTEIVNAVEPPALAILDEPGAGTDPAEGAALAIGLMDYLAARGCIVAVATHATAIKLHAYSEAGLDAAAVDFDGENLTPLYRLKPHTIGQSYGLQIARRLGLPDEIVAMAEAALPAGSIELAEALRRLEEERRRAREAADDLTARERALAAREREAEAALGRSREQLEAAREALREAGAKLLEDLRRDGLAILDDLRRERKSRRELSQMLAEADKRIATVVPAERAPGNDGEQPLKAGDQVELGGLRGELLEIEPDRAVFSRGGLRIEVAPERLRRVSGHPQAPARPAIAVTRSTPTAELNVTGERSGEALRKLEQFLDQAYVTNQSEVRIIHGIGSGALRKAVQEYLATSPFCAGFRLAEPQFGGAGVTVVTLAD